MDFEKKLFERLLDKAFWYLGLYTNITFNVIYTWEENSKDNSIGLLLLKASFPSSVMHVNFNIVNNLEIMFVKFKIVSYTFINHTMNFLISLKTLIRKSTF